MIFWIVLFLSTFLVTILSIGKPYTQRHRLFTILCIILIALSSLRCGLGEDYLGYVEKISYYNNLSDISIFSEPIFVLIACIVNWTSLTPAFFFCIMAVITIGGIFSFYNREENKYLPLTVIFFVLFPALFFNTFNIVRQFAAAGIFFYSLKYVENRKILPYFICIIMASLLHFSSIILLPFYFFISKSFSRITIVLFLFIGLVLSTAMPSVFSFLEQAKLYTVYIDDGVEMGSSSVIILYNILLLLCLIQRSKINNAYDTISFNLLLFLVILSDMSYVNFYFYRLSVFFMPIAAYMLPKTIGDMFGRKISIAATVFISIGLFLVFFIPNMGNPLVVRDQLLPVSSIFDEAIYRTYIR